MTEEKKPPEPFLAMCPLCDEVAMQLTFEKNLLGWTCQNCGADLGNDVTSRVNVLLPNNEFRNS